MSLSSTIAHRDAPQARGFSLEGIGIALGGFALGVVAVLGIANIRTAGDTSSAATAGPAAATVPGMTHGDFLYWNITSYDGLVPTVPAAAIASPAGVDQARVDRFTHINTSAFDGMVPATSATAPEAQSLVDTDFLRLNTTAYDGMVPAEISQPQEFGNATEEFLRWNISSLEYPPIRYSEQPSGPR